MNRSLLVFLLGLMVFFQACEGPPGPPGIPGPQGPQGQAGLVLLGEVFEADVNFTPQNEYFVDFEFNPAIESSDVVLVYIQWEAINGTSVWRLLPQTVFFEEGVLVYNFDFTRNDFAVFLETTFDPSILDNTWTRNQKIRAVVIPADFAVSGRLDYSDYDGIMKIIGATEENIVKIEPKNP